MGMPAQVSGEVRVLARISEGAYPLWTTVEERAATMDLTTSDGLCENVDSRRVESIQAAGSFGDDRRG